MFSDGDIKTSAKVCILGQTVVDNLFPDGSDPLGKVVRFNSIPFRVVGVLKKKGYNSMGMDQDDLVLAPYTTVMKRILAQTYLGGIVCSAVTEGVTDKATEEITEILRRMHKLKDGTDETEGDEDDFNIRSQEELSSMMNSTTTMLTVLLGCVAGISLIVGGIGIMNIMYVSVTERTREIGLRMSVGARGVDILSQFLIEAILLSVTGGIGDIWSRNKNITKGVKVEVGSQEAAVDLFIIVEYGKPIQKVAAEVQENVRKAMEGLTGLHVVKVDVHVQGVSFEMEKKATENLLEASKKPEQTEPAKPEEKPADSDDETVRDEAISEESEFDANVLEEEAAVDGAEESAAEENRKPKRPPKARLRS